MKILKNEMRSCRKGPESWFTGTVWLDEIVTREAPSRLRSVSVWFEPGARTAWHTHPLGQTLYVVAGIGRVQVKGQPPREIRPGDTVWIEAGEIHWHGAAPGYSMTHVAMQEADERDIQVEWLQQVTEEEYATPV